MAAQSDAERRMQMGGLRGEQKVMILSALFYGGIIAFGVTLAVLHCIRYG